MIKPIIQKPLIWKSAITGREKTLEEVYREKAETMADYIDWPNKPRCIKHMFWCQTLSWN